MKKLLQWLFKPKQYRWQKEIDAFRASVEQHGWFTDETSDEDLEEAAKGWGYLNGYEGKNEEECQQLHKDATKWLNDNCYGELGIVNDFEDGKN